MPDNGCDVVVVGASAGGVEALSAFVRLLPAEFAAPIVVVLHVPATGMSVLPDILDRAGALPARHAVDGERLEPGTIYVAPPDCHVVLADRRITLDRGPRENGHRPAIDPLFRSAAAAYAGRSAGVVLSGTLDDGTAGLLAIKSNGGTTLVQDPEEALYSSMPASAIRHVDPDYVLPLGDLVQVVARLAATEEEHAVERGPAAVTAPDAVAGDGSRGELVPFSCPDCGGSLWATSHGALETFRCRVGHAFTFNSLAARHADTLEGALWTAYRALEERAAMSQRVARRLRASGRLESAQLFEQQEVESRRQAGRLKRILDDSEAAPDAEGAEAGEAG